MPSLKPGDKIYILSPASVVNPELVSGAADVLRQWGYRPVVGPSALGASGSFSGTAAERLADFEAALADPEVSVIFCSRGGYGCVHLLPALDRILERMNRRGERPKWLVGFSDVSALHALWRRHGWQSIHSSMAKHLANHGPEDPINLLLRSLLTAQEEHPVVQLSTNVSRSAHGADSRAGSARGVIVGGNMAVVGGLLGTDFDPVAPGTILLMEDVAEPIYKVERLLWQLRLRGVFDRLAGLIVGQFTEYRFPTVDHPDMYAMISRFLGAEANFPVAMDVEIGHVEGNLPLILNRPATLTVDAGHATVTY